MHCSLIVDDRFLLWAFIDPIVETMTVYCDLQVLCRPDTNSFISRCQCTGFCIECNSFNNSGGLDCVVSGSYASTRLGFSPPSVFVRSGSTMSVGLLCITKYKWRHRYTHENVRNLTWSYYSVNIHNWKKGFALIKQSTTVFSQSTIPRPMRWTSQSKQKQPKVRSQKFS